MKRRHFLKEITTISTVAALSPGIIGDTYSFPRAENDFKLKYAPHFGMFKAHAGEDLLAQLEFIAEMGFTALEDNAMPGRPVSMQEKIASKMTQLNLEMGVFVAHASFSDVTFASDDTSVKNKILQEIRNSVEVAKRVNAKWMTVVPGIYDKKLEWNYQTANVIELLKRASEILEPHGLVMVLEPLNWYRDHPGVFLTEVPQAYMICKAVNSPSCRILFDIYHQQITEGNLIPNIDRSWDEISYFQVGDHPGRKEPGTGEINYKNVFHHIYKKGYKGIVGMEHGNSKPGKEGEKSVIDAYLKADDF